MFFCLCTREFEGWANGVVYVASISGHTRVKRRKDKMFNIPPNVARIPVWRENQRVLRFWSNKTLPISWHVQSFYPNCTVMPFLTLLMHIMWKITNPIATVVPNLWRVSFHSVTGIFQRSWWSTNYLRTWRFKRLVCFFLLRSWSSLRSYWSSLNRLTYIVNGLNGLDRRFCGGVANFLIRLAYFL